MKKKKKILKTKTFFNLQITGRAPFLLELQAVDVAVIAKSEKIVA